MALDGIRGPRQNTVNEVAVNEVAQVVGLPTNTVYNFFHRLIQPRGPLKYVSLFKD